MADKETVSDWGIHLLRHLQVLIASFPEFFPPDCMTELKPDHFYGRLPKWLKAMVTYWKASPQEKTYSDYLWATREVEKEDSMELSQNQTTSNTANLRQLASSPCKSSKGPSLQLKHPLYAWCIWKRRVLRRMKKWTVRTLTVLMVSLRNSWCVLWGLWKTPKWKRSAVIIVAVWSTSSVTAHW